MNITFVIRPATAADARAIELIVRAAMINPFGLDWRRFVVAEHGGEIVGVGQLKPHRDGTLELASIAVVAEWQGLGVGGAVVRYLAARATQPLYLSCLSRLVPFYARFGFRVVGRAEMPPSLRRIERVMNALLALLRRTERLRIMVLEP